LLWAAVNFCNLPVPLSKWALQYNVDLQARPLSGPLFPEINKILKPSPCLDGRRRHFLNLGTIQRIDTSPQE
jgi:hypothetical protein